MVPILIVDELPDALDQYSRSGGFSIDRMPVKHPAAPHFLSILPINIDVASQERSHTDKLNNKSSKSTYLHMHISKLTVITIKFYPELVQRPIIFTLSNLILRHKVP